MDMDGLTAHQHDSFAGQPWALKGRSQRSEPVGGPQRHSAKCRTSSADLTSIHHRPQLHSTRGGLTDGVSMYIIVCQRQVAQTLRHEGKALLPVPLELL